MTAAAMQQTPAVPPRPSKPSDKDSSTASIPKIPPRPTSKRLERSVSPNADRFAPSPLNDGIVNKGQSKNLRFGPGYGDREQADDPIERSGSVPMPSVGEEGWEYSAYTDEVDKQAEKAKSRAGSPEQTRTVDADLQLFAPKPSLPALSAKQRVMTVTRTDSDKAASFGIGRPGATPEERAVSRDGLKKKPSTSFSTHSDSGLQTDDEQGIPEIGQRVPMNPHLGDVQAPSPAPGSDATRRHHGRKHSARGLPPGSYGLHGHGVAAQDKLERAYYQKHPELKEKEHHHPLHDRQNDFAMSREDLNKLVRDTASRGTGVSELRGTPTDEVGFQASHEYASRMSRPTSVAPKAESHTSTPVTQTFHAEVSGPDGEQAIHVDDPKHPEYRSYGDEEPAADEEDHEYNAPILAEDEVGKGPKSYLQRPAVHPPPERRGSAFEMDEGPSSRPASRPSSIYNNHSQTDFGTTPLEDVEEYEPLFTDETQKEKEKRELAEAIKARHHFPSKDIWEDAPNSVHYTTEVTTPDVPEGHKRKISQTLEDRSITPAQAFAQHQEELAEKEARAKKDGHRNETYVPSLPTPDEKPTWIGHQAQLKADRPGMAQRFPSRDVWEDAPDSQLHHTTLSSSPKEESKPEIPTRPVRKSESSERPSIPSRPKPKQNSGDEGAKARPVVSDKPKPHVPARPSKTSSGDSKDGEFSKPKPPVPSRPAGGKIAALQAGFMSDLNKRLQLGPQAPKKEESQEQEVQEEKEKIPLSDARKGRARGPQRRAPAKSPAPATAAPESGKSTPTLSFCAPQTYWVIDPEDGSVAVDEAAKQAAAAAAAQQIVEQTPVAEEKVGHVEEPASIETLQEAQESEKTEIPDEAATVEEPREPSESEKPAELEQPEKSLEPEQPAESEMAPTEEKTIVANTAGESILETTVEKKDEGNEVDPVLVDDVVKS